MFSTWKFKIGKKHGEIKKNANTYGSKKCSCSNLTPVFSSTCTSIFFRCRKFHHRPKHQAIPFGSEHAGAAGADSRARAEARYYRPDK
jgi:hypothetical protein